MRFRQLPPQVFLWAAVFGRGMFRLCPQSAYLPTNATAYLVRGGDLFQMVAKMAEVVRCQKAKSDCGC
jgi:hypothetical protein